MPIESKTYLPCITTRESECRALSALAEPTKDLIFPLVRLQAWPREKAGAGSPVQRSVVQLLECFGGRGIGVDLASPRTDLESAWAMQGHAELTALKSESNGFEAWRNLVGSTDSFVPTIQWTNNLPELRREVEGLGGMGRGMIFRFRQSQGWNIAQFASLLGVDFGSGVLIFIFDVEQISRSEDLTSLGMSVQGAMLAIRQLIPNQITSFVLAGSSFPSSFSDIHPSYADLPIRERQLFDLLRLSPPILQAGIDLRYGDHASVFAADRDPAFRGAPRVDYPLNSRWVYHRNSIGYAEAVQALRNGPDWNDELLCWGAQRIRVAAGGDLTGLRAQAPWVSIRLNIHMHLQAHFSEGGSSSVDEVWID